MESYQLLEEQQRKKKIKSRVINVCVCSLLTIFALLLLIAIGLYISMRLTFFGVCKKDPEDKFYATKTYNIENLLSKYNKTATLNIKTTGGVKIRFKDDTEQNDDTNTVIVNVLSFGILQATLDKISSPDDFAYNETKNSYTLDILGNYGPFDVASAEGFLCSGTNIEIILDQKLKHALQNDELLNLNIVSTNAGDIVVTDVELVSLSIDSRASPVTITGGKILDLKVLTYDGEVNVEHLFFQDGINVTNTFGDINISNLDNTNRTSADGMPLWGKVSGGSMYNRMTLSNFSTSNLELTSSLKGRFFIDALTSHYMDSLITYKFERDPYSLYVPTLKEIGKPTDVRKFTVQGCVPNDEKKVKDDVELYCDGTLIGDNSGYNLEWNVQSRYGIIKMEIKHG